MNLKKSEKRLCRDILPSSFIVSSRQVRQSFDRDTPTYLLHWLLVIVSLSLEQAACGLI